MPTAEYRPSFREKGIQIAFLFACGLASLVIAIIAYNSLTLSAVIALMLISLIGFAGAVWVLVDAFLSRDKRVYVCPAGLLYYHRGKTEPIRWDQVEALRQRIVRYRGGVTHRYTIQRNDGARFKFNDQLSNVEALGNTIARETTRLLLPRYMAVYQAGQTVTFGRISLNREGVSNGKERLAWQQVKGMKVQASSLFIQKEGTKWLRWNNQAYDIPNVNMLLALVDSILTSGRR